MERGQVPDEQHPAPLAARWPWWLALLSCLVGLLLSILLEQIHFKIHTQPAFHSFCAIDRKVNCDIVARSPYAVFAGVPLAAWGIFGYAIATVLVLWGVRGRRSRLTAGCGLGLALLFTATSITLGAISALLISAVCLLCLGTYAANLVFLIAMVAAARPIGLRSALAEPVRALRTRPGRVAITLAVLGACAVALAHFHPSYWKSARPADRHPARIPDLPHGLEPGGGHYIGAKDPAITLVEFSDYECPYCKHAHEQLRTLLEQYPKQLRLVHRHYPLDQSCNSSLKAPMHQNSCFAAMVAECAGEQNRFWQANDYLFAEARVLHSLSDATIAHDLGLKLPALESCLREDGPAAVARDVDAGNRLGIQGTPTFLVDGKMYTGALPPWLFVRLQQAAAAAGKPHP